MNAAGSTAAGGEFERAGERVGVHAAGEADLKRLVGVDAARGGEQLNGARRADELRESLSAPPAGDDAEASAGVREDRARRGDADAAGEREVEAAALYIAVDTVTLSWTPCR